MYLYIPKMNDKYGWIEGLAVHPDERGKRIGGFIVHNLVKIAKLDDVNSIQLMSTKSALGFWKRQGFTPFDATKSDTYQMLTLNIS